MEERPAALSSMSLSGLHADEILQIRILYNVFYQPPLKQQRAQCHTSRPGVSMDFHGKKQDGFDFSRRMEYNRTNH